KFDGRGSGIAGRLPVPATVLAPALRDVGRAETGDTLDFAPEIVEHVAPVTEHVDDYSPIVLLAIIPRRSLRGLPIAFEQPISEFPLHRQDAAEESGVDQHLHLEQPRQPEL